MRHVIISDTHAPDIIEAVFDHVKQHALIAHNPDHIVINGDLLGCFSMDGSSEFKQKPLTQIDVERYARLGAPNFYQKYGMATTFSEDMVLEYVSERYQWCVDILKRFSKLRHTIFNMGNHESPHHFLVLQEIPFVFGVEAPRPSDSLLNDIYSQFEKQLKLLESQEQFSYIRNEPMLIGNTAILPIPGESHDAIGDHPPAVAQEKKTQDLLILAEPLIMKAENLIIYNHTQGDYQRETSTFLPLSPTMRLYVQKPHGHLKNIVWVQSHNHWSYTQFLVKDQVHFVLNNAGLHGGIYNILEITDTVKVHDADSSSKIFTELTPSTDQVLNGEALAIIKRNYPNFLDIFMKRKANMKDAFSSQHIRSERRF